MKREIGKWFLDIAKYIVTAVVLKELFGGFEEKSLIVTVATSTALIAFITGILILNSADQKEKGKEQGKQGTKEESDNNQYISNNTAETKPKQSHKKKGTKK